jgi:hypothetical protein
MALRRLVCLPVLAGAIVFGAAPPAPARATAPVTIADDQPNPLQPVICALKADAEGCKKAEPPK